MRYADMQEARDLLLANIGETPDDYADRWQRCYDGELTRLLADGMAPWLAKLRVEAYAEQHANDEEGPDEYD